MLELVIDAEGRAVVTRVETSAGAELDALAIDVAQQSQFSPALRDGEPVAVRVLHEVQFEGEPPPPTSEAATTDAPPTAPPDASYAAAMEANSGASRQSSSEPSVPPLAPQNVSEVVVRADSRAESLRRSARAVEIVDLREHHRGSSDLGDVLARATSLRVQRTGGLGSSGRYSLAGLSGDRVRFFLDGIPLEYSGYSLGVANVPVSLIDSVEVYQGVVPARFGADALGGAVHLVTDQNPRKTGGSLAYEFGSFDTHRLALGLRHFDRGSGLFAQLSGFLDSAENDYPIDVEVFDEAGRLSPATVRRFHDGYRGLGGSLSLGVVDRPWANRLILRAFASTYDREVQHNTLMTVPYGEVTYGKSSRGGSVQYVKQLSPATRLDVTLGYAYEGTFFDDASRCRYDWYGRCFLELPLSGESRSIPIDRDVFEHAAFARAELTLRLADDHTLRFALAPTAVRRSGRDRAIADDEYDPLRAERSLYNSVLGLEYEAAFGQRLSNIAFSKLYQRLARSEEKLPTSEIRRLEDDGVDAGFGDSLRISIAERLYVKASYEWATRLPTADERFGDGALIVENLRLSPERSHNANVGLIVDNAATPIGSLRARLNGAVRDVSDLVLLLGHGSYFQYANVLSARILALDAGAGWSVPGDFAGFDLFLGVEDARNTSTDGPGAMFEGDRLPNRPFMQAGLAAYLRKRRLLTARDFAELNWNTRYVHGFFLGWESAGSQAIKLRVPSQTVHGVALSHVSEGDALSMTNSFEVRNVTNAEVYDFYGVQRPGRSYHWKITIAHD